MSFSIRYNNVSVTEKLRSRRWKLALNIITILALFALAFALREQLRETFDNLHRVNLLLVVLIIPTQTLSYVAQANLYQNLFRAVGDRFRFKPMLRLVAELNFVNIVFPSGGVSGFSYIALRLKNEKVSTAKATLIQMMRFIMIFIAMQVWLFLGVIALAIGGQANDFAILLAGIFGTLITVGTIFLTYIIGSKTRINMFFTSITRLINWLIRALRPHRPEAINISRAKLVFTELHENFQVLKKDLNLLRRPLIFALLFVAGEVLTIYVVYLAFGRFVNIGAVVMAYAVANFAGTVSILPGGIGVYEALMTGVLSAGGIPAAVSLPVTVMYRVLVMSMQLPLGYFFYHKTLHARPVLGKRLEEEVERHG